MAVTVTPQQVLERIDKSDKDTADRLDKIEKSHADIQKKLAEPRAPWVTSGPVGQESQPYSILRAAAFCTGNLGRDQVKNELDMHDRLKSYYKKYGWIGSFNNNTFLMPANSASIPTTPGDTEGEKLRTECRQKMTAYGDAFDPDEARWLTKQSGLGWLKKALGTISDSAGGVIVGFPTLGELIDLQRNMEAFANAGATEIGLPPNGRMQFPKLTGGATAYWVGEAAQITASQPSTGYLDLIAKKLGILVQMNNELIRFASPTAEAMVRLDMARVAALKADLSMLTGTGGTEIKGLLNYDTQSSWTPGTDKLIKITATTADTNGDTLGPKDIQRMIEALPDAVPEPTAFMMRKAMWAAVKNFRADAATAGDAAGLFMFSPMRQVGDKMEETLAGYKVVRSSQVSTARVKGSGTNLSYVLTGYFPDWLVARFGVMEFLATNLGDTAFQYDQTWLRGIQLLDAGPRHAASFVMIDNLLNNAGA